MTHELEHWLRQVASPSDAASRRITVHFSGGDPLLPPGDAFRVCVAAVSQPICRNLRADSTLEDALPFHVVARASVPVSGLRGFAATEVFAVDERSAPTWTRSEGRGGDLGAAEVVAMVAERPAERGVVLFVETTPEYGPDEALTDAGIGHVLDQLGLSLSDEQIERDSDDELDVPADDDDEDNLRAEISHRVGNESEQVISTLVALRPQLIDILARVASGGDAAVLGFVGPGSRLVLTGYGVLELGREASTLSEFGWKVAQAAARYQHDRTAASLHATTHTRARRLPRWTRVGDRIQNAESADASAERPCPT